MTGRAFLFVFLATATPAFAEIQVSSTWSTQPDIAWNGSKFGVVYWSEVALDPLVLVTIDKAGTNPGPEIVAMGISAPRNPVIVPGPGVWAAAWTHPEVDGNKIYFAAFDDAGTFTIPPVQVSGTSGNPNYGAFYPSMVFAGSRYYVTWQYFPTPTSSEVDIAGIDADGTISIPWQTSVPDPAAWPWIAWNAETGTLGLAWIGITTTWPPRYIFRGSTLSSSGLPTGTVEDISPAPNLVRDGRLGAHPGGFAFGCRSDLTSGSLGQGDLYFTPLDANMDPVSAPVPLTNGEDNQRTGNLVWTGVGFIWPVEHFEPSSLYEYLYRFDQAGSLIGPPVRLSDQPQFWVGSQWGPRAALAEDEVRSLSAFHGDRILDLAPYAAGYGASVGAGDIETNPLDEILTGPGPGAIYGPQVRAFRGNEKVIPTVNFYAYGTLKYGVHVTATELDGDGIDEILTAPRPGAVFGPHIRGFNFDGSALTSIRKLSFYAYRTLKYGAELAGGDVEADGYGEILTGPGPGLVFGAQLRGFNYDNNGVTPIPGVNALVFPGTDFGLLVGAGDVTGNGRDELLASPGPDPVGLTRSEVRMFSYSGGLTKIGSVAPFTFAGGCHIAAADMDLQGGAELVATPAFLPANPGRTKAYTWTGSAFQELPEFDQDVFPGLGYGASCAVGNMGI